MSKKPLEDPNITRSKALMKDTQRHAEAMWQEVVKSRQLLRETRALLDATKPKVRKPDPS